MDEQQTADVEPEPTVERTERPVLRRSRDDRVIAGVSGGLGRYLSIDPILLRIAFVVLFFIGGAGLLLYLLAWLVMPLEREGDVLGPPGRPAGVGGREIVGLGFILLGALFLLRIVVPDVFDWTYVWPVALILVGLLVLVRGWRR